jgi:phosphatidylinositol glycan class T
MALSFGFIFNLLVRRFVALEEADQWDLRAVRLKVVAVVKRFASRFKKREKVPEKKE